MVSKATAELITERTCDWQAGIEDRLIMYRYTLDSIFSKLRIQPEKLLNVADIATGYGTSTLALGERAINAHIYGCSLGEEPSDKVSSALGSRFSFQEAEFSDFLKSPELPSLDLVLMAAAPYHGLAEDGGKGYLKLGEKIKRGGYFLVVSDSKENIDTERMKEAGFVRVRYEDASVVPSEVWQRV